MSKLEWSTTAADNDDADANIVWTEGQAPSTVNNSARAMMAAEASWLQGLGGALTTAGTGAAYTLTLADAPTAYSASMLFLVKFHAVSSSTTATININALGAKTLKTWRGAALPSTTHIPVNAYGLIKYDGTDFRVFLPNAAGEQTYEEGSFTPTFTFGTPGDLSVAYTVQVGRYTRIGNRVLFDYSIAFTPTYTTASGNALFQGLPIVSANVTNLIYSLSIGQFNNVDVAAADVQISARMTVGVSQFTLHRLADSASSFAMTATHFPSGTAYIVHVGGSYQV